jgi:hypothetical protein
LIIEAKIWDNETMYSREQSLARFLAEAFDPTELRRWTYYTLGTEAAAQLPESTSLAELSFQVVLLFIRLGTDDGKFFDALLSARPARKKGIQELRSQWRSKMPQGTVVDALPSSGKDMQDIILHTSIIEEESWLQRQIKLIEKGGPIQGSSSYCSDDYVFPSIDLKILNNSRKTMLLTDVILEVENSAPGLAPVLAVVSEDDFHGNPAFWVRNYGWGVASDCEVSFSVAADDVAPDFQRQHEKRVSLGDLSGSQLVSLSKPHGRGTERPRDFDFRKLRVFGEIGYRGMEGARRKVRFHTQVAERAHEMLRCLLSVGYRYHALLHDELACYSVRVPISQVIKPGEADRFVIQVAAPRASIHRFRLRLIYNNTEEWLSAPIELTVWTPNVEAHLLPESVKSSVEIVQALAREESRQRAAQEAEIRRRILGLIRAYGWNLQKFSMQDVLSAVQNWDISGIVEERRLREAHAESGGSIAEVAERLKLPQALTTLLLVRFGLLGEK